MKMHTNLSLESGIKTRVGGKPPLSFLGGTMQGDYESILAERREEEERREKFIAKGGSPVAYDAGQATGAILILAGLCWAIFY